ncbi:MAG: 50S ribosomal protein L9 [Chloroflexi bacterium]|nr:50S ribosomal protein L9 [Chloroflexota bacterium]
MKVVFLKDVANVARAGDVKEVADGFGRNYLIPQKLAMVATAPTLKGLELNRVASAHRQDRVRTQLESLADSLKDLPLSFKVRVGARGRLYGSVTSAMIAEAIQKQTGHEVDKHKVELEEPLRTLGTYEVPIKLGGKLTPRVKVTLEKEEAEETKD